MMIVIAMMMITLMTVSATVAHLISYVLMTLLRVKQTAAPLFRRTDKT